MGDLAVTAVLAAGLLAATAAASASGRTPSTASADAGASHVERSVQCRAAAAACSVRGLAHVRLTMEPRTGVCLA